GACLALYEHCSEFRKHFDHCAHSFESHLGFDVREKLFEKNHQLIRTMNSQVSKSNIFREVVKEKSPLSGLHWTPNVEEAQPLCFSISFSLARTLMTFGVDPTALIGYSVGEYVA